MNYINKLVAFRKELHKFAELSGNELETAKRVKKYLEQFNPDELIIDIGGHGILCVFKGKEKGKTILFRCDMDAVPIKETNSFGYKSESDSVSHMCGHDGHMAIMVGLAEHFSINRPKKGNAMLLFQPSEENGVGAKRVIDDSNFKKYNIDYAFALHNLPGFEKGTVILKDGTFAAASKGIIIKLNGKTSHAGEPEDGINPAIAMSEIVKYIHALPKKDIFTDYVLTTVIHAKLGEVAFGTAPGYAHVMATLRSYSDRDMKLLTYKIEEFVKEISGKEYLKYEISYTEEFPATVNDIGLNKMIGVVSEDNKIRFQYKKEPFRWSEDFGYFTQELKGALFGLGSGINHPQLHNSNYDFPDEIIKTGVKLFYDLFIKVQK